MKPRNFLQRLFAAVAYVFAPKARYEATVHSPNHSWLQETLQPQRFDAPPATRQELMRQARWMDKNEALVNRLADIWELFTVGQGIHFTPSSSDEEWNTAALEYIETWNPLADLVTRQSFDTLQGVISRALLIDGESFILLTRSQESGRPRIQVIESSQCQTPPWRREDEGRSIIDGVEVNAFGRPVGYWFIVDQAPGRDLVFRQIPAEFVVHAFEPSRAGQYRGITMLAACLTDLKSLVDLQYLEMKAARDAAEVANIFKRGVGSTTTTGDLIASGGEAPTPTSNERYESVIGGKNLFLDPGDEMTQLRIERPSDATRNLWAELENRICDAVGIPRQLVRAQSIQGTVARSVLQSSAAWFKVRSTVQAEIYRRVIEYVLSYGILTEPDLAEAPMDWRRMSWRPPRSIDVDPGRSAQAQLAALAGGVTNYEAIYSELGLSWQRELTQRADEVVFIKRLAEERDITPQEIVANSLPPAVASQPEDPEDDMIPTESEPRFSVRE